MTNGEKPLYSVIEVKEKLSLMTQEEMTVLFWRCNGYSNSQISVNTGIKLRDVSKIMEEIYKNFEKFEGHPQTKRVAFNRCVCDVVKLVITSEADLEDWVNIKARLAQELEEAFPDKYKDKPEVKLEPVEKSEEAEEEKLAPASEFEMDEQEPIIDEPEAGEEVVVEEEPEEKIPDRVEDEIVPPKRKRSSRITNIVVPIIIAICFLLIGFIGGGIVSSAYWQSNVNELRSNCICSESNFNYERHFYRSCSAFESSSGENLCECVGFVR